jgi:hypothetical protein
MKHNQDSKEKENKQTSGIQIPSCVEDGDDLNK